jgi:fumarate reductase flavoprotein subunit
MQNRWSHKILVAVIVLAALQVFLRWGPAGGEEKKNFLADRHQTRGNTCTSCHPASPPKADVPMSICLGCHGPYAKLAERTGKGEHNPHASHLGDIACDLCHHGHKPSVDHCSTCHSYGLKVP